MGAQDEFQKAFGLSWNDALEQGLVYNLVDGAAKLGLSMSELGTEYDKLKKGETMLKFGGGFYCGKVKDVFVINGFYASMREQFTKPGTSILLPGRVESGPTLLGRFPWKGFGRDGLQDRVPDLAAPLRVQRLEGVGPRLRAQHREQRCARVRKPVRGSCRACQLAETALGVRQLRSGDACF